MDHLLKVTTVILFLLNTAWAQATQYIGADSLSKAVIQVHKLNSPEPTNFSVDKPYSHQDERNNSLARAALAKQGTLVSLWITNASQTSSSNEVTSGRQHNSFYRGVLAR